ncbi:hypothetical protein NUW54_g442 [Trametes sanguinea]|uniref:Uncharacterized protein n=1 Tax=Trametes sanguinea TaxID=158606 RepID=A0ACC1QAW5_9APHY|nr:hypothetical protein NUW54_g442 [Trametes sanguinea]
MHYHRVMPGLYVCIVRRESASHYFAYITDAQYSRTIGLVMEVGLWPTVRTAEEDGASDHDGEETLERRRPGQ